MKKLIFSFFLSFFLSIGKLLKGKNFKPKIQTALLFIFISSLFFTCKQDLIIDETKEIEATSEINTAVIFNVGAQQVSIRSGEDAENFTKTELGDLRQNPYTITNMASAHRNLYGSSIQEMPTTDLYVKFTPSTFEELDLLLATDEFFYDYPLEYEVVEMGDYYQELAQDEFPILYAIVKPDFEFPPNVNDEIISPLYLNQTDLSLVYESFKLTGNGDDPMFNPEGGCAQDCPNYPDCLFDDNIPCGDDTGGGGTGTGNNNPPCDENSPYWPDCLLEPGGNTYEPSFVINDCGCAVYPDIRAPGGCINVEDTELGMLPVRRVKVIMKDTWFTQDITYTDDNGCWKMNERYKGRARMRVQFKNDRCKIRGTKDQNFNSLWYWKNAVKDYVGKINGPYFNNIAVNYMDVLDNTSNNNRYHSAATVNNAVHEFYDYADDDGILPPPSGLDIYIARNKTNGFALMSHSLGAVGVGQLIGTGLLNSSFFSDPVQQIVASVGAGAGAATISSALPDVMIGTNFDDTDDLKNLAYHEIAHASMFRQVGSGFWIRLGSAEIAADGWGNGSEPDAGIVQVSEGWAEHIGDSYTDRTYGLSHSNGGLTPIEIAERRWINLLESDLFDSGHIPVAMFHDLIDDNSNPILGSIENGTVSNDGNIFGGGVSGYSNQTIFSHFNSFIVNPIILRERLKTALPTGVTSAAVDALFSDYGF